MDFHYTTEKNVLIVLALLKANGIKKVIASPGATNESIVASMQYDPYFEMYSCVDERSAAYMACGMAAESGEIVVLSCTGATSSRNYMPGLTEAYYRHLPILAITSSMDTNKVGHLYPQCTDRSTPPSDTVVASYCIETIKDDDDEWDCNVKVNNAISDLKYKGGGPVHLNLITRGCNDYSIRELPKTRVIKRIERREDFPSLECKKVLVFIGSHLKWNAEDTALLDSFCEKYGTIALCDKTSGYSGMYSVQSALLAAQEVPINKNLFECDILIHIGGISGDYYTMNAIQAKEVWRVDEDGKIKDKFKKLTNVFVMSETEFLSYYISHTINCNIENPLGKFKQCYNDIINRIPELPFSNIWIASRLSKAIPYKSILHLGILNTLRSWNFFDVDKSVSTYCNVGGFGIDGIMSTLIGASLVDQTKLYFAVLGDLAFFYDLNSLGNRNVGNNVRIMLINNGRGVEFHTYRHSASKFGEDTDKYIAAAWHNGNQSQTLVKSIATSLGFEYLSASNKNEFNEVLPDFVKQEKERPIIFEVFIHKADDADVLRLIRTINCDRNTTTKQHIKNKIKTIVGESAISAIKKTLQ